ncbi:hypothetical protein BOTBODRAFT_298562 [Botryobasidium botryosum FD-172 SS1]|uniref:Uncharacterized protein n=1 Tax=Botryobasidium botryosum (strain FD-172 SS1) TaxID=930990 RepID=A0A067LRW2_BOTB1|nr:hypothetical protein BOTBODRAFT_298562 [Botryobasidium botryosum FD-172 SS1]
MILARLFDIIANADPVNRSLLAFVRFRVFVCKLASPVPDVRILLHFVWQPTHRQPSFEHRPALFSYVVATMADQQYTSRFRFVSMGPDRFQLRTINAHCFPANPNHPRLFDRGRDSDSFPLQVDGTFGDRDLLLNPIPYQKTRPWVHYIPTEPMWTAGFHGWKVMPIYVQPAEHGDPLWISSGILGRFSDSLKRDLRRFHDIGVRQALKLHETARHYKRVPVYGSQLHWEVIEGEGTYYQMLANLVGLQRRVAELYGWIFLQEKLQPDVPSINPRPRLGLQAGTSIPALDLFLGVLVPWSSRSETFDSMAISHGLALWWVDYIADPNSETAPWQGLSEKGQAVISTHRGGGFVPARDTDIVHRHSVKVDVSGHSKSFLDVIVSRTPAESGRFNRVLPSAAPGTHGVISYYPVRPDSPSLAAMPVTSSAPITSPAPIISSTPATPSLSSGPSALARSSEGSSKRARFDSSAIVATKNKKKKPHPSKRQREAKRALQAAADAAQQATGPESTIPCKFLSHSRCLRAVFLTRAPSRRALSCTLSLRFLLLSSFFLSHFFSARILARHVHAWLILFSDFFRVAISPPPSSICSVNPKQSSLPPTHR